MSKYLRPPCTPLQLHFRQSSDFPPNIAEEIIESISSTVTAEGEEVENSDVDNNIINHTDEDGLKRSWDDNWSWEDKKVTLDLLVLITYV